MASDRKTYKREVSFAIMASEMSLIGTSAIADDPAHAEHLFRLAQFLMPFASGLLMAAFGADWWSRQNRGKANG
jgi:hypothetical protein